MKNHEEQNKTARIIGAIILVFIFVLYSFRIALSAIGIDTFLFLDNLLEFSKGIHPMIVWSFLGLFIGLLYGSFAAWKKYRLEFKLNFIPLGVLVVLLILLFLINKPLQSKAIPPSNIANTTSVENDNEKRNFYLINSKSKPALIYSCPETTCSILSKSGKNHIEVEVLEFTNDSWCKVKLYSTIGYMERKYLVFSHSGVISQQGISSQTSLTSKHVGQTSDTPISNKVNNNDNSLPSEDINNSNNNTDNANTEVTQTSNRTASNDKELNNENFPELETIKGDLLGKSVSEPNGYRSWRFDYITEMKSAKILNTIVSNKQIKYNIEFNLSDYKTHEDWHIITNVTYWQNANNDWIFYNVSATLYEKAN